MPFPSLRFFLSFALFLATAGPPVHAGGQQAGVRTSAAEAILPLRRTVIRAGRTAAVPLKRLFGDREYRVKVRSTAPEVFRVLEEVVVFMAGKDVGFARIEGRRPGIAFLEVDGAAGPARLEVRVVAAERGIALVWREPRAGAALLPGDVLCVEAVGPETCRKVQILLDGRPLAGTRSMGRLISRLPEKTPPGAHRLEARAVGKEGGKAVRALDVIVLSRRGRAPVLLMEGEVAAGTKPAGPTRRRRARSVPPDESRGSVGHAAFLDSGQEAIFRFDVPEAGHWQLRARARGDRYLGDPLLGVFTGSDDRTPLAWSWISTSAFATHAVGRPLKLAAGTCELRVRFLNDARGGRGADRNLYLDRLEVHRVPDDRVDVAAPVLAVSRPRPGETCAEEIVLACVAGDEREVKGITVRVDGRRILRRKGPELRSRLQVRTLAPGTHRVEFVARDAAGHETVRTREIVVPPFVGERHGVLFIPAAEAGADPDVQVHRTPRAPGGTVCSWFTGGHPVLFPFEIEDPGVYALEVIARGDPFKGWPRARLRLDGREAMSLLVSRKRFATLSAGTFDLARGPHTLEISFENDACVRGEGDRNLHVAGVRLRRVLVDETPPQVFLRRVPSRVVGPDLVIAEVSDNHRIADVGLIVDGRPQPGSDAEPPRGLWLRGDRLEPGRHTLKVVARDPSGNVGSSERHLFVVERPGGDVALTEFERALILVERLGLGGGRRELERLLLMGERAWVDEQLQPAEDALPEVDFLETAALDSPRRIGRGFLRTVFMRRMIESRRPGRMRLAAFFENHFNTYVGKTGERRELIEWRRLRRRATSTFRELLGASAHGAAMMVYLDNQRNRKGRPNENYAREIMELHTLGIGGGYSLADIVALSRILTGWRAGEQGWVPRFAFLPALHDGRPKRALGVPFRAGGGQDEGEWLLDVLAAHPNTARFVSRKLAAHLLVDDPPEEAVSLMARAFLESGGDVASVVRALLDSRFFFRRDLLGTQVRSPLDLVVGLARAGAGMRPRQALRWLGLLDQMPFECQPPTGYPERDQAWLDSQALLTRWNLATEAARGAGPALRVRVRGRETHAVRDALEEAALDLMGRLPPGEEIAAAVEGLSVSEQKPTPREILEAVMRLPAFQRK